MIKNLLKCFQHNRQEYWWERYTKKTLLEKLHIQFNNFIAFLTYDLGWKWLDYCISYLCDVEMGLDFDDDLKELVKLAKEIYSKAEVTEHIIPEKTFYCEDCPFQSRSKVANFFYGYQLSGYCYYLGKGDYSYEKPTDILWDGCKCCGINEDIDIEEDENDMYEWDLDKFWEKVECDTQNHQ